MTAAEKKTGHEEIKEYVLDVGESQTTACPPEKRIGDKNIAEADTD